MGRALLKVHADPLAQFQRWYREAKVARVLQPDAMALATATNRGIPSVRMVLYKGVESGGFLFFTNYQSPKARDLTGNPRAALVFHWSKLARQVRVEGRVRKLSYEASNRYFQSRPRESQLSALASEQSAVLLDRRTLEGRVAQLRNDFIGKKVPCPAFWGGFCLTPSILEFWQGRDNRLHDRFRYIRAGRTWKVIRLAP